MDIKVIVFDLDDTLLDTTGILIPIANTPEFLERIKKPLPLMDGALQNLKSLKEKYSLCLITIGKVADQKSKVKSLEISDYFEKIYYVDATLFKSKITYFEKVIKDFSVEAENVLSIGNRRSMEIRDAKKIGATTCLFKYGEHQNEKAESPFDSPDFEITNHSELIGTCRL